MVRVAFAAGCGAVAVAVMLGAPAGAAPGDAIVPGAIRVDATFENLGVVWSVSGDVDLDSQMTLEFRRSGDATWRPGAPAVRAYPTIRVQDGPLGLDRWAASAMFLEPGTTYDLRMTLTDPDGGGEVGTVTGVTRVMPVPDAAGRTRYVVPGSGGGTGTSANPFRGLQAAADAAAPGDTIDVAAGTYAPFELTTSGTAGSPIAFVADGDAIVDGGGTTRGVVTLGRFDRTLAYVIVEGFVIQDGRWGVDAQNTQDVVIAENTIQDVDFGILNRRGRADERNQTVCDNVVVGRTPWPGVGIPSERGIDLRGTGNVVCHNEVSFFGDCVSVQPSTGASFGSDVFGNDASYCVDDGIEVDYNEANVRVWRNRVTNARMGVSVQPIRGGPAYIVRNELFNLESVPIKMHNYTTGLVVAHNTGAKHGNAHGDNGAMWRNATFRNNLFLGTRYAFEMTTIADEGFRDFDYNAWGTTRTQGGASAPYFKWDNVRYDRIGDLPPGVEDNGVAVGFGDLIDATLPADWDVAATPGSRDLRLVTGSAAVDAGVTLPNLNDLLGEVGAPDLGAFELGAALPVYGPRSADVGSRFVDVPRGSLFFTEIEWLASTGITRGCNPPFNDRFCPDDVVTREQMASFLVRALGPAGPTADAFVDDDGSIHEHDIELLASSGITRGCNPPANDRFCPTATVTREQMASFLVRALGLAGVSGDRFADDDASVHEHDIELLATGGITRGCNPPVNDLFCPRDGVTRGHLAVFLYRGRGLLP